METVGTKGVTKINTEEVNYSWTIENFLLNGKKKGEFIQSQSFSSDSGKTKWYLHLYPKGLPKADGIYLYIHLLELNESKKTLIEADVKISALYSIEKELFQHKFFVGSGSKFFFKFTDYSSQINEYLVNGNLTVICKIRYGLEIENLSVDKPLSLIKPPVTAMNSNLEKLIEDLENLMDKQLSCDTTLVASGEKIHAHKVILCARSPVFSALFSHDTKENKEKLITIEDAEPDTVKEMLRFMYTGRVQSLEKLAYELFSLSDKYALHGLREMCEESMCKNITIENAVNILVLSDLHSAKILKKSSMTFIKNHLDTIINTDAYKTLETSNLSLIAELLRFIASK